MKIQKKYRPAWILEPFKLSAIFTSTAKKVTQHGRWQAQLSNLFTILRKFPGASSGEGKEKKRGRRLSWPPGTIKLNALNVVSVELQTLRDKVSSFALLIFIKEQLPMRVLRGKCRSFTMKRLHQDMYYQHVFIFRR